MIFQFTPLREGRLRCCMTWIPKSYFNSRPCGRGDRNSVQAARRTGYFNSRPCGRGDKAPAPGPGGRDHISIHAPAGGATAEHHGQPEHEPDFNSRPCGRGDRSAGLPALAKADFNSRPCGRGDPIRSATLWRPILYFNSRPCGRGDLTYEHF